jgi:hypothetical protein
MARRFLNMWPVRRYPALFAALRNVRFWHKADIVVVLIDVRFWG